MKRYHLITSRGVRTEADSFQVGAQAEVGSCSRRTGYRKQGMGSLTGHSVRETKSSI
jgi:hypothetical protein